jgi:hypothetical protein
MKTAKTVKTGKLTLENLTGGWSKDFTSGISRAIGNYNYSKGFGIHFSRPGYLGDMSSSPDFSNENNSENHGYFIAGVNTSTGNTYLVTNKGFVYKKTTSYFIYLTNLAFGIETNLTGVWIHINTAGEECLFYTTVSSTPKWSLINVKISDLDTVTPGATVTSNLMQDFSATTEELTYFRKGIVGPANKSYILNGGYISTYDPVTNVVSATSLLLGKGWVVTSITNFGNYVAIVGNRSAGSSRLWLWDGSSTNVNFAYEIKDFYSSCVINDGGALYVFTKGKNNTTKLRAFTGNDFAQAPIWEYPTNVIGNPPTQDNVEFYFNQVFWYTDTGNLFSFGSPVPNVFQSGLHNIGDFGTGGGMCKNLVEDKLFLGNVDLSNTKTILTSTSLSNSVNFLTSPGIFISKLYTLPHKANIENIQVYFSDFSNNYSSFKIELFKQRDEVTDLLQADTLRTTTEEPSIYYYSVGKKVPKVDDFYIKVTMTSCSVRKIEIDYSYEEGVI